MRVVVPAENYNYVLESSGNKDLIIPNESQVSGTQKFHPRVRWQPRPEHLCGPRDVIPVTAGYMRSREPYLPGLIWRAFPHCLGVRDNDRLAEHRRSAAHHDIGGGGVCRRGDLAEFEIPLVDRDAGLWP